MSEEQIIMAYQKEKSLMIVLQEVDVIFDKLLPYIAKLPFQHIVVEYIGVGLKYRLEFPHNKLVTISSFFDWEGKGLKKDDIEFSYFENKEHVITNAADINEFVKGFSSYINLYPL